ncbi:MAG: PspA/IM30 family protein [Agathobaculum sp.]|jgi:phage shock protein A|uniref:PspA/IM30 family protein n=1 Tax=Agathobaculum sp. TaxID=2048138 RepID=UPI003D8D82A1
MGILERFSDIIRANINDLLDKAEDPAKMIDQYLRDLTENLAEVKKETAGVMAEETRAKRMLEDNAADMEKYSGLARKALSAGNEGDARTFLTKKQQLSEKAVSLQATYDAAHANAQKMREMHDKLVSDIETLNARREMIKAKVAVAKTQQKVNKFSSGADKAAGAMDAFSRMEAKADAMLDQANAMAALNEKPVDEAAELEKKYGSAAPDAVDDELAKLKAEMGL